MGFKASPSLCLALSLLCSSPALASASLFAFSSSTCSCLAYVNLILPCGVVSYFFVLGWNSSLDNGNAVALYSVLTMPIFFCYAFWYYKNNILIKYILSMTSVLFIIFSFSISNLFKPLLVLIQRLLSSSNKIEFIKLLVRPSAVV